MNTLSNALPEVVGEIPPAVSETRPFYWSIRRELWENRSVYLAPLIVAAVVLFASMIATLALPMRMRKAASDPAKQQTVVHSTFSFAPAPIMLASFIVGLFYSLDALYGERRDRSILFWKSLPVSDRTTVLSKATIPIVVLPLIAYLLSVAVQVILLFATTLVLLDSGNGSAALSVDFRFLQDLVIMLYGLTVHSLWFAPAYCFLLLISAWARRAPILWAVLPPLMIGAVEKIAFNTTYFMSMLKYRVVGAMSEAFIMTPGSHGDVGRISQLDPVRFLAAPGLWVGLLFAAACLFAAIRLRRNREPI